MPIHVGGCPWLPKELRYVPVDDDVGKNYIEIYGDSGEQMHS
jgi:hypothetical protein